MFNIFDRFMFWNVSKENRVNRLIPINAKNIVLGSELPVKNKTTKDVDQDTNETGDAAPVKFRRSQKEELAKAHQVCQIYSNKS